MNFLLGVVIGVALCFDVILHLAYIDKVKSLEQRIVCLEQKNEYELQKKDFPQKRA